MATVETDPLTKLAGGGGHEARGINDAGRIVGEGFDDTESGVCKLRAFYWEDSSADPFNLGTVPPLELDEQTRAMATNNRDPLQVVGTNLGSGHGMLWSQDEAGGWTDAIDLQGEIDPASGWALVDAHDINDVGCIVGWGLLEDEQHAFLLYEGCLTDCAPGQNDAHVGVNDLLQLLAEWDTNAPYECQGGGLCDQNNDGCSDVVDLLEMLSSWGPCCRQGASSPPQTVQDCLNRYGLVPLALEHCICAVDPQQCE